MEAGRPLAETPAAQRGHNSGSIAICLHGLEKAKFTKAQFKTLRKLCLDIQRAYNPKKLKFRGHCEVSSKACPVYDYKSVLGLDIHGHIRVTAGEAIPDQCPIPLKSPTFSHVLSNVMSGGWVKELQTCFSILYSRIIIDGLFGQQTRLAVESAQRSAGLPVSGELTKESYSVLVTLKIGDKGEKVTRIQRLLNSSGSSIKVDGTFGPETRKAVLEFQERNGLAVDGVVGPKTLSQLSMLSQNNHNGNRG